MLHITKRTNPNSDPLSNFRLPAAPIDLRHRRIRDAGHLMSAATGRHPPSPTTGRVGWDCRFDEVSLVCFSDSGYEREGDDAERAIDYA